MNDNHAFIGKQLEALKNELIMEVGTREADIFELRELVGGEMLARSEHHKSVHELIAAEQAAREAHDEKLMDVKAASDAHRRKLQEDALKEQALHDTIKDQHASISEQLDALKDGLTKEVG